MSGRSARSLAMRLAAGGLLLVGCGCAVVPRSRVEQSQKTDRMLRTELAQAKDELARLKSRNRDILARSTDDTRRLAALEEANERYQRDITAYQEERDQYAAALDQIKSQVLASSNSSQNATRRD